MEQAAPQRAPSLALPWRDLNVFVASFAAIVSLAGFAIFVPLSLVLKLVLPSRQAELLAWPLGYGLVAVFLCWRWWKHGLSPRQLNPARAGRFRVGHVLLAVFNVTMAVMFLGASLGAYSLLPRMPSAAGMVVGLVSLAPIGVLVGLVMVLSARGTDPAFADTLPVAPGGPQAAPTAKWPVEPAPAGSAPSLLVVLSGLVVSSLVLFMAGVFGALAFANDQKLFSNVVLPIAFGVYVLYVSIALWLLTRRRGAANWVAWTPMILVIMTTTLGPLIAMLVR